MTREEFNAKVMEQFNKYKAEMVSLSPERIFNCAYGIAKMAALKDYLTETDNWDIGQLYHYADRIFNDLYEYEWNYDDAQWTNWENISYMIFNYMKEEK